MKKLTTVFGVAIAMTMACGAPSEAHARGWLAKHIIKPIAGERAARNADHLHEQLNKPGDAAVDAAKAAIISVILR